jgi:outer membrane protein assembly factor BamB
LPQKPKIPSGANLQMTIDQLIFVGLNGYALALSRTTGLIVWSNDQLESGPVTLLLDGDRLIVSTGGYIFCLDPLTGKVLWNNPLKGYGQAAPAALVSVRGQSSQLVAPQHAAAGATATAAIAGDVASASGS